MRTTRFCNNLHQVRLHVCYNNYVNCENNAWQIKKWCISSKIISDLGYDWQYNTFMLSVILWQKLKNDFINNLRAIMKNVLLIHHLSHKKYTWYLIYVKCVTYRKDTGKHCVPDTRMHITNKISQNRILCSEHKNTILALNVY